MRPVCISNNWLGQFVFSNDWLGQFVFKMSDKASLYFSQFVFSSDWLGQFLFSNVWTGQFVFSNVWSGQFVFTNDWLDQFVFPNELFGHCVFSNERYLICQFVLRFFYKMTVKRYNPVCIPKWLTMTVCNLMWLTRSILIFYMTEFISRYESLDHSVPYVIKSSWLPKLLRNPIFISLHMVTWSAVFQWRIDFVILDTVQESEWAPWHTNMLVLVRINTMVIKNVSITLCWLSV